MAKLHHYPYLTLLVATDKVVVYGMAKTVLPLRMAFVACVSTSSIPRTHTPGPASCNSHGAPARDLPACYVADIVLHTKPACCVVCLSTFRPRSPSVRYKPTLSTNARCCASDAASCSKLCVSSSQTTPSPLRAPSAAEWCQAARAAAKRMAPPRA